MTGLLQLPPELLSRIVGLVAIKEAPKAERCDEPFNQDCKDKYDTTHELPFSSLCRQHKMLAIRTRLDVASIRNLRLASRHFFQMCTTHLFSCVRLLPIEASATRYNAMISTTCASEQVREVVFQTRMVPDGSRGLWSHKKPGPGDDYDKPHPFFIDALKQVGRFPNLTHVELVFASPCGSYLSNYMRDPEDIAFREEVLGAFYAGLNHPKHLATKIFDLSIKNLQDHTPGTLVSGSGDEDNDFRKDFEQVMSRIRHLSLQIATEDEGAAPENTLRIPEAHDFFGHELQTYWIGPLAQNLVYMKLYANEMLFGLLPVCNLPTLPKLRTLILGNLSIANDDFIDWIISRAATLEELVFDDATIAIGARFYEEKVDIANCRVIYSPLQTLDQRPSYQPTQSRPWTEQSWLWPTRWHHIFPRLQHGLPKLQHFAIGHGNWDDHLAFDEADALSNVLLDARYQFLDRGMGPDNWLTADNDEKAFNDWEEDEEKILYQPECDEEDWKALKDLLDELKRRR